MKRLTTPLLILAAVIIPLLTTQTIHAQFKPFEEVCDDARQSEVCQNAENEENPVAGEDGVLVTAVRLLSFVVGVASVIMVILGSLKYVTSNGDANAISSAKNTILYALIGLAVFAFSQAIVVFVISKL